MRESISKAMVEKMKRKKSLKSKPGDNYVAPNLIVRIKRERKWM
jgi:hypothetical protein